MNKPSFVTWNENILGTFENVIPLSLKYKTLKNLNISYITYVPDT